MNTSHAFRVTKGGIKLFYGWFESMHTRFDLILSGENEQRSLVFLDHIASKVEVLNGMLNRFDTRSELYRINHQGKGSIAVDPILSQIISGALEYKRLTHGMFDVAVGTPSYNHKADYYDLSGNYLIIKNEGLVLDFGGYAKGFVLDYITSYLKEQGVTSALISFGGSSVSAIGNHPLGSSWSVAIEQTAHLKENPVSMQLANSSISISGNSHGKQHIISPITHKLIKTNAIVTVSGASALDCEVASTAIFAAMGNNELQSRIIKNMDISYIEFSMGSKPMNNIYR